VSGSGKPQHHPLAQRRQAGHGYDGSDEQGPKSGRVRSEPPPQQ
jgi:hypothetical protein